MKKIISLITILALVIGCPIYVFGLHSNQQYAINETNVIIDYVAYPIQNNSIHYYGKTFVLEDYTLVCYDEDLPCILALPVWQNAVTDDNKVNELNESIGLLHNTRAIPTAPVNLPYQAAVAKGDWETSSPAFNLITGTLYTYTCLKLSNFSLGADKNFLIQFYYCDVGGNWYCAKTANQNFGTNNTFRVFNASSYRYGKFYMTNLYGNPSPSYIYTINKTNS